MRVLLMATTNSHKLEEYRAIFSPELFTLLSLRDIQLELDIEETGTTFAENAELKALGYARAAGMLTLADDFGIEIDALGGAPGIILLASLDMRRPTRSASALFWSSSRTYRRSSERLVLSVPLRLPNQQDSIEPSRPCGKDVSRTSLAGTMDLATIPFSWYPNTDKRTLN